MAEVVGARIGKILPWRARRDGLFLGMKNKRSQKPASSATLSPPTHDQVAALAHQLWIERGCPEGSDMDNWLEAERILRSVPVERTLCVQ